MITAAVRSLTGEGRLLRLLRGRRQGAHRAAVEAALEHDELAAGAMTASELDGALDRLGAGVAEEYLASKRPLGQPSRKAHRRLGVVEVAHVHEPAGLVLHGPNHGWVAVPHLGDGDSRQEVQVLVALVVPEPRALAADELDRVAHVRAHHRPALVRLELL
jgi:hypothetical protein